MRSMDTTWKVLAAPLPHAIAHRGSRVLWPENTMTAFQGAVDLGYRWLETDVHVTADDVVVCLHDDSLDRTTDRHGDVSLYRHSELRTADAGYRHAPEKGFPFRGAGIEVPTLEEVVTSFPDVNVVIDLKCDGTEGPVARLIGRLGLWDRVVVGGFDDARLARFRHLTAGRVAMSTGPRATFRRWVSAIAGRVPSQVAALQVPERHKGLRVVTERTVERFSQAGIRIHVWTVDEAADMHRLLDWGVHGLISDRPDVLRRVLEQRNGWTGAS